MMFPRTAIQKSLSLNNWKNVQISLHEVWHFNKEHFICVPWERKVMKRKFSTVRWPLKPALVGKAGRLEDAGTHMSWLDAKVKCQGYLVQLCSQAVTKCPTVWLTETSDVVTYALCGVWQKESWSMAGIFGLAWNCMEMDGEATCIRLHDRSWRICFLGKVRACIWAVAVFTSCKAQPNQEGLEWENA